MKSPKVTLLDEAADLQAEPGSRSWSVAIVRKLRTSIADFESDAKHVAGWLEIAEERGAWRGLGYASFDLFLSKEIRIDSDFATAIRSAKSGAKMKDVAAAVAKAKERGLRQGKRTDLEHSNNVTKSRRGNDATYLLARLQDQFSEIAAAYERGEFKSVRAAAIEAGIVKPPDRDEIAIKAFGKAENRLSVLRAIVGLLGPTERVLVNEWTADT